MPTSPPAGTRSWMCSTPLVSALHTRYIRARSPTTTGLPRGRSRRWTPRRVRAQLGSVTLRLAGPRPGQLHPRLRRSHLSRRLQGRQGPDRRWSARPPFLAPAVGGPAPRLGFRLDRPRRRAVGGLLPRIERDRLRRPHLRRVGGRRDGPTGRRSRRAGIRSCLRVRRARRRLRLRVLTARSADTTRHRPRGEVGGWGRGGGDGTGGLLGGVAGLEGGAGGGDGGERGYRTENGGGVGLQQGPRNGTCRGGWGRRGAGGGVVRWRGGSRVGEGRTQRGRGGLSVILPQGGAGGGQAGSRATAVDGRGAKAPRRGGAVGGSSAAARGFGVSPAAGGFDGGKGIARASPEGGDTEVHRVERERGKSLWRREYMEAREGGGGGGGGSARCGVPWDAPRVGRLCCGPRVLVGFFPFPGFATGWGAIWGPCRPMRRDHDLRTAQLT